MGAGAMAENGDEYDGRGKVTERTDVGSNLSFLGASTYIHTRMQKERCYSAFPVMCIYLGLCALDVHFPVPPSPTFKISSYYNLTCCCMPTKFNFFFFLLCRLSLS